MIVCLAIKTTGFVPGNDEILQISMVDENGKILLNEYIKPERVASWPSAEMVNHISPQMVEKCQHIEAYAERIESLLDSAEVIVGYKAFFDLDFISRNLGYVGINVEWVAKCVTVMEMYAEVDGEWSSYHQNYRYEKLTECAAQYGYKWTGGAHDSLNDALATLYCWPRVQADYDRIMTE